MYSIFYISNGAYVLSLNTTSESDARECVESLRIAGKEVLIKRDGKRINWRLPDKVWRGAGRAFASVADALAAYKTPEMKAIIAAVDARNA